MDFFAHFAVLAGGKSGRFLVGPIKSIRGARAVGVETDSDAHGFFIGLSATWPTVIAAKKMAAEKVMLELRGGKGIGARSLRFGKGVGNKGLIFY